MKIFTDRGFQEELSRRELAKEKDEYRHREWHELRDDVRDLRAMTEQLLLMMDTVMKGGEE